MLTSFPGRSRSPTALLVLVGLGAALTLGVTACSSTPGAAPTAAPTARPAVAAANPSPVAAASPASAAIPAPTPGGVPPTVVGRASPVAAAPSPAATGTPLPTVAARITITSDGRFDPPQVTVNRGDTVQWVNMGRSPQTVTADPARVQNAANVALPAGVQPWDSGVINSSQTYYRTFDTPGTYRYVSLPDESDGTIGQITVQG
jgi:plastocyanin